MDFIFLDVETTGLDPKGGDRLCEIALLKVKRGEETDEMETLVNPMRPIPLEVQAISRITDEMVKSAPPFSDIAASVLAFLEGGVIVAHNVGFDVRFLDEELAPWMEEALQNPRIDTLNLARNFYRFPSYSLGSVAAGLKIPHGKLHRAMEDTRLTREIFYRFLRDFEALEMRVLDDILDLQKDRESEWNERIGAFERDIRDAIMNGRTFSMKYLTRGGIPSERTVKPLELQSGTRYVYMRAFCFLTGEERSFRLDRIIEMRKE